MIYDVIVIGGGIVGFSTAMQLKNIDNTLKILVLEKEATLAQHQTGHNSGVIHAGVYYKPGSLKAQFCIAGCQQTKVFCELHNIPYRVPGKLVIAINEQELTWMDALAKRCQQNGLTVESLTADQVTQYQPGLQAAGAFFVKETGIVSWQQVCHKYGELFNLAGGEILYGEEVVDIKEYSQDIKVKTKKGNHYCAKGVIACSGLHADRLVKMTGMQPTFKIIPFRGEYQRLTDKYNNFFNHLIYPVPNPALPFLGVHFTPQINGFTTAGPNAVLALAREGYSWKKLNIKDCLEIFSYAATWKMLAKHTKATLKELYGSLSKQRYLKLIQQYVPSIQKEDLVSYPAGVRAQAVDQQGNLINDFLFVESERILHTCNAPSPAATSSLPIGKYIAKKFIKKITC